MDQLEDALTRGQKPAAAVVERALSFVRQDVEDLLPTLQERAEAAVTNAAAMLAARGREEAKSLADLLTQQRRRIEQAEAGFDDRQTEIDFPEEQERRQRRADPQAWQERPERIERELETEPRRSRRATRSGQEPRACRPRLSLASHRLSAMTIEPPPRPRPRMAGSRQAYRAGRVASVIKELGARPGAADPDRHGPAHGASRPDGDGPAVRPMALFAYILGWAATTSPARLVDRDCPRTSPSCRRARYQLVPTGRCAVFVGDALPAPGSTPGRPAPTPTAAGSPRAGRQRRTSASSACCATHRRHDRRHAHRPRAPSHLRTASGETRAGSPARSARSPPCGPADAGGLEAPPRQFQALQRTGRPPALGRSARAAATRRPPSRPGLAEQVLGALHELLRGMATAEPALIQELGTATARSISTRACSPS